MLASLLLAGCACAGIGTAGKPATIPMAQAMVVAPSLPPSAPPMSGTDQFTARTTGQPGGGMVVIGPPVTASGSEVVRSGDGLFYVTAIVNGAPIRFLVDTGASLIVLRAEDARRAGVWTDEKSFNQTADTAGGRTAMARVMLDEVVVGATRRRSLNAAVVGEGLPVSLLGQNWLAQLGSLTISGDRMLFN